MSFNFIIIISSFGLPSFVILNGIGEKLACYNLFWKSVYKILSEIFFQDMNDIYRAIKNIIKFMGSYNSQIRGNVSLPQEHQQSNASQKISEPSAQQQILKIEVSESPSKTFLHFTFETLAHMFLLYN